MRTTVEKALHQVKRGRRKPVRAVLQGPGFCACIGMCQAAFECPVGRKR